MQVLLFALTGFSSGVVNMVVYNLVLWVLRMLGLFSGFDFLIAQFFGFVISVGWVFWLNRKFIFRSSGVPWKQALIKSYISYSITGIGLSSLLSLLWVYAFHIPKEILSVLNDLCCFPVNFLLSKYWSFRKRAK